MEWNSSSFVLCGWNELWNVAFAMWFFDFPILVHKWGYFSNIHFAMLFCLVVCYVFSHLVFCRIIRSRVFGGCPFLVGSLCFAGQQEFDSCVPLCFPLLDPVGLSSLLFFIVEASELSNNLLLFDNFVA